MLIRQHSSFMDNTERRSAVVVADTSGRIAHFNQDAELLFGHTADDALGASLDLIVPPEHQQAHWEGFHRAMRTARAKLEGTAAHLPVVCADGEIRVFPGVFSVLRDPFGNAIGAVATYAPSHQDAQPFTPITAPAQQVRPGAG
ncbi:hypothetical protein GCM10027597_44860 [Saccharopolyspora tripterygii]